MDKKRYISDSDYKRYIAECDNIYGKNNDPIDFVQKKPTVNHTNIFLKAIYELYKNHAEVFDKTPDENTTIPFIYVNNKTGEQCLCADNVGGMLSFIKNNKKLLSDYDLIEENIINANNRDELMQKIRDELIGMNISKVNKGRRGYKISNHEYFAVKLSELKKFIAEHEND